MILRVTSYASPPGRRHPPALSRTSLGSSCDCFIAPSARSRPLRQSRCRTAMASTPSDPHVNTHPEVGPNLRATPSDRVDPVEVEAPPTAVERVDMEAAPSSTVGPSASAAAPVTVPPPAASSPMRPSAGQSSALASAATVDTKATHTTVDLTHAAPPPSYQPAPVGRSAADNASSTGVQDSLPRYNDIVRPQAPVAPATGATPAPRRSEWSSASLAMVISLLVAFLMGDVRVFWIMCMGYFLWRLLQVRQARNNPNPSPA